MSLVIWVRDWEWKAILVADKRTVCWTMYYDYYLNKLLMFDNYVIGSVWECAKTDIIKANRKLLQVEFPKINCWEDAWGLTQKIMSLLWTDDKGTMNNNFLIMTKDWDIYEVDEFWYVITIDRVTAIGALNVMAMEMVKDAWADSISIHVMDTIQKVFNKISSITFWVGNDLHYIIANNWFLITKLWEQ